MCIAHNSKELSNQNKRRRIDVNVNSEFICSALMSDVGGVKYSVPVIYICGCKQTYPIDKLSQHVEMLPDNLSTNHIQQVNGAISPETTIKTETV